MKDWLQLWIVVPIIGLCIGVPYAISYVTSDLRILLLSFSGCCFFSMWLMKKMGTPK